VDLIKTIRDFGCVLIRSKGKHDWYQNPNTGVCQPVPAIVKSRSPWQNTSSKC